MSGHQQTSKISLLFLRPYALKNWPFFFCFFIFFIYLLTLHPSVPGGDSGMIIGASYTLGVSHPPGYPLYTMLGHLFSYLPIGSIGFRINLMTALLSSFSSLVFILLCLRLNFKAWITATLVGIYAFSPLVWEYSLVSEFFSMNNLFVLLLLYLSLRYYESRNLKWAKWGAFLFSLGLCNHHTLLFIGTPLSLWILFLGRKEIFHIKILLQFMGLFALGLLPYIYLPISASQMNFVSWGDPSTLDGFITHFFRKEFGTFKLGTGEYFSGSNFLSTLAFYFSNLFSQTLWGLFLIPAVFGVISLFVKNKNTNENLKKAKKKFFRKIESSENDLSLFNKKLAPYFFMILFMFILYISIFHILSNFDLTQDLFLSVTSRFWQLPLILVLLLSGVGLNALSLKFNLISPYFALIPLFFTGLQLGIHYKELDRSQDKIFIDWGIRFLDSMPANSILLSKGDINLNILKYIQGTMNLRKDVQILDQELLKTDWYSTWIHKNYPQVKLPPGHLQRFPNFKEPGSYTLDELISLNIHQFEIYKIMEKDFEQKIGAYPLRPMGKLWQVLNAPLSGENLSFDYDTYMKEHKRRLFNFIEICRYPKQSGVWEKLISVTFQRSLEFTQFYLFEIVKNNTTTPFAQQVIRDNIEWGEIMLKNCSELNPFAYKNLGLFYYHLANKSPEERKRLKEIWETFIRDDQTQDKTVPWIKSILASI